VIPAQSVFANMGEAPLDVLIMGVSRDSTHRVDSVDLQVPRQQ
jgi:hypothetical protein